MNLFLAILKSIVFGIVEGITEWLPISSTGHLILLNAFMPLTDNMEFWNMYKYIIQLGAIMAVIILYFYKLNPWASGKSETEKKNTLRMWLMIAVASVPTGIVGLALDDFADEHLNSVTIIAVMLIVYGIAFIIVENTRRKPTVRSVSQLTYQKAFLIGLAQSLAVIPGTSRSGSTILGASLLGLSRSAAAEFSFFLAIPVMFGISLLKLIKHAAAVSFGEIVVLLVGMAVSFIVSMIVIRSIMRYVRTHSFKIFGLYRIVLGFLILILGFAGLLTSVIA